MGVDGLEGARAMVEAGGAIIVQDKASSIVWGMPGAIAQEGLASAILPVETIAVHVAALLRKHTAGVAA
jgi:two-component system, chemotaxis family, protein-glutamate methylesterase/glutaminase